MANTGSYADHEHENKPVCGECILAVYPHVRFSDDAVCNWLDCEPADCDAPIYHVLPDAVQEPCWSCDEMENEAAFWDAIAHEQADNEEAERAD